MSDRQRLREPQDARQVAEPDGPTTERLGELSASAQESLDRATDILDRLTPGKAQEYLTQARQRGGQ